MQKDTLLQANIFLGKIFLQEYTEAGGTVKYKTQLTNKTIINETNINSDPKYINFFEAYTDSIAIIFNSIFNSRYTIFKNVFKLYH